MPSSLHWPVSTARACWRAAFALGAILLVAGCGADNAGEPRTPAEDLMAPNPATVDGRAHVYCVETDARVTPCDTWLDVSNTPSRTVLRDWWLHAAAALRRAGTFAYKDGEWRFESFSLDQEISKDEALSFGWRCPGDRFRNVRGIWRAMDARSPLLKSGIQTLAAAQRRGCVFGTYPELPGSRRGPDQKSARPLMT